MGNRISKIDINNDHNDYQQNNKLIHKNFDKRMEYYKDRYKKNTETKIKRKIEEENNKCTFKPQIGDKLKQGRTNEQFWKDQQNFIKEKNEKLKRIKQNEIVHEKNQIQEAPRIGRKSIALTERKRSHSKENVHERLFKQDIDNFKSHTKENESQGKEPIVNSRNDTYLKNQLDKKINDIAKKMNLRNSTINSIKTFSILFSYYSQNIGRIWIC